MNAVGLALAALAVAAIGFGFDAFANRQAVRSRAHRSERVAIACLAGLGVWSAGYGVFLLAGWVSPGWLMVKDTLLVGLGAASFFRFAAMRRPSLAAPDPGGFSRSSPRGALFSLLALASGAALFIVNLRYMLRYIPDGGWDAWAIWSLRARFLYLGQGDLAQATTPQLSWSHPDYPLLLPGLIANVWTLIGTESPIVPAVVSLTFAALCVSILSTAVAAIQGTRWGVIAAMMLLGTPAFLEMARRHFADIPLATFSLAAVVLARRATESDDPRGLWAGAGVLMSLAAWTKNEGLLHFLVLGIAILGFGTSIVEGHRRIAAAWAYLRGAAPGLLLLLAFKLVIESGNDLVSSFSLRTTILQAADLRRWEALVAVASELLVADLSEWAGLTIAVPLVIAANLTAIGERPSSRLAGAHLGLWAAGVFLVYLCTPRDMVWHLRTSVARVFMQGWPTCIFVALLTQALGSARVLPAASPPPPA